MQESRVGHLLGNRQWFQLSVPALVYTVQNWALYVGAAERVAFAIPRDHADGDADPCATRPDSA